MRNRERGVPFARKSLGQNFLADRNVVRAIVDGLGIGDQERVVEIGPGRGALTSELLARGAEVTAIEIDRDLVPELIRQFGDQPSFRVVEADALTVDFHELADVPVKLVANLPYYISTPILRRLAIQRECFSSLVLMLQKEVVDRMTALPGKSDRGFLTVVVEAAFEAEQLFDVPPDAFRPVPKVTSSVVRLTPKGPSDFDEDHFERITSAGFRQKRKTLLNNLKHAPELGIEYPAELLSRAGIDPKARAEDLSLDDWIRIVRHFLTR